MTPEGLYVCRNINPPYPTPEGVACQLQGNSDHIGRCISRGDGSTLFLNLGIMDRIIALALVGQTAHRTIRIGNEQILTSIIFRRMDPGILGLSHRTELLATILASCPTDRQKQKTETTQEQLTGRE